MFSSVFKRLCLVGALSLSQSNVLVLAHMRLKSPSPLGEQGSQGYDVNNYDYRAVEPISAEVPFPCHGKHLDIPAGIRRTAYTAGEQITITVGSDNTPTPITHDGGSCQFSLSYDGGASFGVIHSVIGGCPKALSYSFQIPAEAPAGDDVLFAWTWFNKDGAREMYMSCAAVTIQSSSSSLTVPAIFEANNGNGCTTIGGDELVFPNPGDAVTYGGKWLGKKPTGADTQAPGCSGDHLKGRLITLKSNGKPLAASPKPSSVASANVGDTEDESQTGGHGEDEEQGPIVPKAKAGIDTIPPGSDANQADTPAPASEQKVPSPAPVPPTDVCKGGIKCSPDGKAFSVCGLSGWIPMGSVAPGTLCQEGAIGFAEGTVAGGQSPTTATCSPGQVKCAEDGRSFYLCHAGVGSYIPMGAVAPGTVCQAGAITFPKTRKLRRQNRHRLASFA